MNFQSQYEKNSDCTRSVIHIDANFYIHVLDKNSNISRLICGPCNYFPTMNEELSLGPTRMTVVSHNQYCMILNPVLKSANGPVTSRNGVTELRLGERELRFHQEAFPLYPGEELIGQVENLPVILRNYSFEVEALHDLVDEDGERHLAGDRWVIRGPAIYKPRLDVCVIAAKKDRLLYPLITVFFYTESNMIDVNGTTRSAGEYFSIRGPNTVPSLSTVKHENDFYHVSLSYSTAIMVTANTPHYDDTGQFRRYGERWLLTWPKVDQYIGHPAQTFEKQSLNIVSFNQYAVIDDPLGSDGLPQLGRKRLVVGPCSFFTQPGESLANGVEDCYILGRGQALVVKACKEFFGRNGSRLRKSGEKWLVHGPCCYIPPIEVEIILRREVVPLDKSEGIYVRNNQTGVVRSIIGQPYMMQPDEELWYKPLSAEIIELLNVTNGREDSAKLDTSRAVTLNVPSNAVVQIIDYTSNTSRVEFGPCLVMLEPYEDIRIIYISSGCPKGSAKSKKSLILRLGPDTMSDQITAETSDHMHLCIQLSYTWYFHVSDGASKFFTVQDFVGAACSTLASTIRSVLASVTFRQFHKNSTAMIQSAVFGVDENGHLNSKFMFPANNLCITSVDVQSIEPVCREARAALEHSICLAVQVTIAAQEEAAKHEAALLRQKAEAALEHQRIEDETMIEKARCKFEEIRCKNHAIELTGALTCVAQAQAETARMTCASLTDQAKLQAETKRLEEEAELRRLTQLREAELEYMKAKQSLENNFNVKSSQIDVNYFSNLVETFGTDFIQAVMNAEQSGVLDEMRQSFESCGIIPDDFIDSTLRVVGNLFDDQMLSLWEKISSLQAEPMGTQ